MSDLELLVARIAGAIGEPARARILCNLMDGRARTSTELSVVSEVSPSTASDHLARLKEDGLVSVLAQGRHRYYRLCGREVAAALESLTVLAGQPRAPFVPNAPACLRQARTCYDHMAGKTAVVLHDRFKALNWLEGEAADGDYRLTRTGEIAFEQLDVDLQALRARRRRFASPCLDWSERRPHLGGALGAAWLKLVLGKGWMTQDLDSRALRITRQGRREFVQRLGLDADWLAQPDQ